MTGKPNYPTLIMNTFKRLAFLGCLFAPAGLSLAEQITNPDLVISAPTPERAVAVSGLADADAGLGIQGFSEWVNEFEKQFGRIGVSTTGKLFFAGQAPVRVGPLDPNFGKELYLAYERAIFDMQADFVLQTYGRLQTMRRLEMLEDRSTNQDQFEPVVLERAKSDGTLGALFDKALTLMDKKLDAELLKQGVPADQVARMSIEQKKVTFKDNFSKEIVRSAVRNMQGLVPVQTRIFSVPTPNGKGVVVGVIAAQSEKTRQFAKDMSLKRATNVRGEPTSLISLLPSKNAGYLDEVGLRYSYDESGRPMLLSYGRWSVALAKVWSLSRVFRAKQSATETARALAESSIVEFMNTNIEISTKNVIGNLEEEISKKVNFFESGVQKGYDQSKAQVSDTIDQVFKNAKADSSGDLRGTSLVKSWEQTDSNGILHVGAVVTWTFGQLSHAESIDRDIANTGKSTTSPSKAVDQSRSSKIVNRVYDF